MAKHKFITDTMFTVDVTRRWSKNNAEYYYEIELIDQNTGKMHKTYVSESNYNFDRWELLIELIQSDNTKTVCIEGKFRSVKESDVLINADSDFTVYDVFDRDEFLHTVYRNFYA